MLDRLHRSKFLQDLTCLVLVIILTESIVLVSLLWLLW